MIDNSIFFRPEHAKHICMIFIKKLCKNVSPPIMDDVLALSHVADCIMLFVFSEPTTYEKAIRNTVINCGYIKPIHPFRSVIRDIMEFDFFWCSENETGQGFGKIGDPRRRVTTHDPQPIYAGYRRETRTSKFYIRRFLCCICSSCGEFQVDHHNSWVNYFLELERKRIKNGCNRPWILQFKYSVASPNARCSCKLDGNYGTNLS